MKKVTLYTLSTCPWCMRAKKWFAEHQVPVDDTDYDLADRATQERISGELDAAGASGFPVALIGDQVVEGYEPDRYSELLGIESRNG